MCENK